MATFDDVLAAIGQVARLEQTIHEAHVLDEQVAPRMLTDLQALYGQQIAGQEDLAPATQAERERLGFPPDEPLLRMGDLRGANRVWVDGDGSVNIGIPADDPLAVVAEAQEFGTATIPARPRVGLIYLQDGQLAADAVGEVIAREV